MQITGRTGVFTILGDTVALVRAPELFKTILSRHGIDTVRVPACVPVADHSAQDARMAHADLDLFGFNELSAALRHDATEIRALLAPQQT
jgi:shikimate 5-dehydrogenase